MNLYDIIKIISKEYNIVVKKDKGIEDLNVKTFISSNKKQLIVSVTNKTGEMIGSGYIEESYYDEDNNKIMVYGTDSQRYNMFKNDSEIVYGFELPTENYSDYYIPSRTEVEIIIDEEYQEQASHIIAQYVDNFSYSYVVNEKTVSVNIKNEGNVSELIPRSTSVVFYKNNRPVYSKEIFTVYEYLDAGKSITKEVDIPEDYEKTQETGQDVLIDYDSIKIYRLVEGNS